MEQPADIGRELLRFGAGQKRAEIERVEEALLIDPLFFVDQHAVHQRDLRGGAAERQQGNPRPGAVGFGEARRGVGHAWRFSSGFELAYPRVMTDKPLVLRGPSVAASASIEFAGGHRARMIFNSLTFLVFFAIVLAVWYAPLAWTPRKIFLLVASYLFYAAWNPPFVILLWVSTVVDWWAAQAMVKSERQSTRRAWMLISRRRQSRACSAISNMASSCSRIS